MYKIKPEYKDFLFIGFVGDELIMEKWGDIPEAQLKELHETHSNIVEYTEPKKEAIPTDKNAK